MKIIEIIRGGQPEPITLKSGDKYDSVIKVLNENGDILTVFPYVNTDFTTGYQGGILAEGAYFAMIGLHQGKYPAPMLFNCNALSISRFRDYRDITDIYRKLPSLIPNPNHSGQKVISAVNIHKGGTSEWDYSHGCITIHGDYWDRFISNFEMDEVVVVNLIREKSWIVPEFYKEKI